MNLELNELERRTLRAELKKLVSIYDTIMENAPTTEIAELCNTLSDILDRLDPPVGVINE